MANSEHRGRRRPMLVMGLLLLVLAAGLMVAFNVIGSHVDENGWLHEPFPLIPLAWLSGLIGVVVTAVALWRGRRG